MNTAIADITPDEHRLLSCIKRRLPLFLGETGLTNFQMYACGYDDAMRAVNEA